MPGKGAAVRARAAEVVFDVAGRGRSLDAVLDDRAAGLEVLDRPLLHELCFGTLRWYWRCKGIVDRLVERPLRERDRIVEAVLAVGVYQLEHMRLPPHAAIHTAVEACAVLHRAGFKGLVNGALRNFQRRRDELVTGLSPSARDAHPEWLWQAVTRQWPRRAPAIFEANNSRAPMTLRVNTRRVSVARCLDSLRAGGIDAAPLEHAPEAVVLSTPAGVERLPGFEDGWFSVQDASAQMLARLTAPEPGWRVLDACAAPGGKLTHVLEAFPGVRARAIDSDPVRARRIGENLQRLGLEAEVTIADAAVPDQWWDGHPFDLVILDAPCSGTGVIRRHPDIKLLRRESDIGQFCATQQRLLDGLWQTVRSGGRLLYVTCSILAPENEAQIDSFLRRAPDALDEAARLPVGLARERGWQILPEGRGGDGFYYAALRKQ